jgi:hypothetical protein
MKAFYLSIIVLSFGINDLSGQNRNQMDETGPNINLERFYLDAGGGYFPENGNASWAGQLSVGYRLKPNIALGVGAAYWGRINVYERSAWGLGVQYRQRIWNINVKAEVGGVLKSAMYDGKLNRKMDHIAASFPTLYYKLDINWRIWHYLTLGISASQTNNLTFRRYLNDATSTFESWRINALTLQLGIALDTKD